MLSLNPVDIIDHVTTVCC